MESILLALAINLASPVPADPYAFLSCEQAQDMIIRVYLSEDLTERQKQEVAEELLGVAPAKCAVPQLTTARGWSAPLILE